MLKRVLIGIGVVLLLLQAVRPARNEAPGPSSVHDFVVKFAPPESIRAVLDRACYDCHSNHTRYPWYSQVQPVAWWLGQHIHEGKSELNLSEFGTYPAKKQRRKLNQMSEAIAEHEMPLRSYTWIHGEARLNEDQVREITGWLDELGDQISGE
jgi:hypothetical protein